MRIRRLFNSLLPGIGVDWCFVLGLMIVTTLVYATGWGNDFLSDDILGIVENPGLGDFGKSLSTWSISSILFSLIYRITGPVPFLFHVVSTLFHVFTLPLVYSLIYLLTDKAFKNNQRSLWTARSVAFLFALHPIEVESVAWISGLPYAVYPFFLLASFLLYILIDFGRLPRKWFLVSLGMFVGAILSAVTAAFILPLILIVYEILFSKNRRKKILRLAPFFAIFGIRGLLLVSAFSSRIKSIGTIIGEPVSEFNPLIQIPNAVYAYIKLTLLPLWLSHYHVSYGYVQEEFMLAFIVLAGVLTAIIVLWRLEKLITFGLLFYLLSLAPTFIPVKIAWPVAERYVRFGSIGLFLALTSFVYLLIVHFRKKPSWRLYQPYVHGILALFSVALVFLTLRRIYQWRNGEVFGKANIAVSPLSFQAHNNLGNVYLEKGDMQRALDEFMISLKLRPNHAPALHNVGYIYLKSKEASKAAEFFRTAVKYNPTQFRSYILLGIIAMEEKQYEEAKANFLESLKYNKDPFIEHTMLSVIYTRLGDPIQAQEHLASAQKYIGINQDRQNYVKTILRGLEEEMQE